MDLLADFYEQVTGVAINRLHPGEYAELRTPGGVLAITSQRKLDARTPGAATPAAKRSLIVDFRVEDVDRERAPRADRAPVRPRADGPAVGQPRDAVPRSGRKPGQRLPPDPSLGLLRGYSSAPNRASSRFKNSPTSVTIPVDSTEPRSASFVTTAGLMST